MTEWKRKAGGPSCPGPVTRPDFLRPGGLALAGIGLADVLAGRTAAGEPNCDTAVILLYLHGGPSHLETYDLKPDAPTDYRLGRGREWKVGPFQRRSGMIRVLGSNNRFCDGLTRRDLLHVGAVAPRIDPRAEIPDHLGRLYLIGGIGCVRSELLASGREFTPTFLPQGPGDPDHANRPAARLPPRSAPGLRRRPGRHRPARRRPREALE